MKLYFLRHGLAEDRLTWNKDDALRPLTAAGEKAMGREADLIASLELDFSVILTSPYTRCQQTAEIVARRLDRLNQVVPDRRLSPGFGPQELKEILAAYSQAKAILLVGHEPDFSETISSITGGSRIVFKKGGLARVDLDNPTDLNGVLVWLIPPRLLAK
jgi:phosphohistidine phosphatase